MDPTGSSPPPSTVPAPPRTRKALRSAGLALLGFLVLAGAGELASRLWLQSPAVKQVYTPYGWIQTPHSRIVYSHEGHSVSRLNSYGFHDSEVRTDRPPVRGLLMGDSYAQAEQMPPGDNFDSVAERALPGLELINTGYSGRSPIHYALYLPTLVAMFHPDVVVIQLNDGDIRNLERSGILNLDPDEGLRRFLAREPSRVSSGGILDAGRWVARHSALANFIYRRGTILGRQEKARLEAKFTGSPEGAGEAAAGEGDAEAASDTTTAIDSRVVRLMDVIGDRWSAMDLPVILVYIPAMNYTPDGCTPAFPARRRFYHEFARRHGFRLVDAAGPFEARFRRTGQPLHGFMNSRIGGGHINAAGHEVVGTLIAEAIRDALGARARTASEASSNPGR